MKCTLCGKSVSTLYEGPEGVGLCEECKASYEEERSKVVELEPVTEETPDPIQTTEEERVIACEVRVGVYKDGSVYFNASGEDTNLLIIDGLIKYAERHMKAYWDQKVQ